MLDMVDDQAVAGRIEAGGAAPDPAALAALREFRLTGMIAPAFRRGTPAAPGAGAGAGAAAEVESDGTEASIPESRAEESWWSRQAVVNSTPIDRSLPQDPMFVDKVIDLGGGVTRIIRRPVGYPSGGLPPDPTPLADVAPDALCNLLSSRASLWCMRGLR